MKTKYLMTAVIALTMSSAVYAKDNNGAINSQDGGKTNSEQKSGNANSTNENSSNTTGLSSLKGLSAVQKASIQSKIDAVKQSTAGTIQATRAKNDLLAAVQAIVNANHSVAIPLLAAVAQVVPSMVADIAGAIAEIVPDSAAEIVQRYPASEQQVATSIARVLATVSSDEAGRILEAIGAKNPTLAQSIASAVEANYVATASSAELKAAISEAAKTTVTGWTVWTQSSESAPTVNKYQQLVDNILAAKAAGSISSQQAQDVIQQAVQQSSGNVVVPSPSTP
ncbi:MAG: hypothetical protein WAX77_14495 [Methylococcaceae bacterium]